MLSILLQIPIRTSLKVGRYLIGTYQWSGIINPSSVNNWFPDKVGAKVIIIFKINQGAS